MNEKIPDVTLESMTGRYLCFSLGRDKYAIPLLQVKEVIASTETTPVPQTPPYFKGILNLRGQVISVVDLRLKLKSTKADNSNETTIIILDLEHLLLGVVVDSVDCVVAYEQKDLSFPPSGESSFNKDFLTGVARNANSMTLILNMSAVLGSDDYKHLESASRQKSA